MPPNSDTTIGLAGEFGAQAVFADGPRQRSTLNEGHSDEPAAIFSP